MTCAIFRYRCIRLDRNLHGGGVVLYVAWGQSWSSGVAMRSLDAIQLYVNRCHLTLNLSKCKFLCATRRRAPCFPAEHLLLGSDILEQVDSYHYLGVKISYKLTWTDYIEQVSTKVRSLVGMLYRQF